MEVAGEPSPSGEAFQLEKKDRTSSLPQKMNESGQGGDLTETRGAVSSSPMNAPASAVEKAGPETPLFQEVITQAKEYPYLLLSSLVVLLALIAGIVVVQWNKGSSSSAAQTEGATSGVLYAVRLAHIRNAPTSIGTIVIGDIQSGQTASGVWVVGKDGTTLWLRINRPEGVYGYIWGRNLSRTPTAPTLTRSTAATIPLEMNRPSWTGDQSGNTYDTSINLDH